jgi:hypothetical protein
MGDQRSQAQKLHDTCIERNNALDQIELLKAALRKYGGHSRRCSDGSGGCTCGWIDAFPTAMGATQSDAATKP